MRKGKNHKTFINDLQNTMFAVHLANWTAVGWNKLVQYNYIPVQSRRWTRIIENTKKCDEAKFFGSNLIFIAFAVQPVFWTAILVTKLVWCTAAGCRSRGSGCSPKSSHHKFVQRPMIVFSIKWLCSSNIQWLEMEMEKGLMWFLIHHSSQE